MAHAASAAGLALGLGAAAQFAPIALAPLFARRRGRSIRSRGRARSITVIPFIPDGGLRELYDRTIGYQAGRGSPFSIWGQEDRRLAPGPR